MRAHGTRTLALCVAVGLIGLAGPASASAATQIGETFVPDLKGGGGVNTFIQTVSPNGKYTLPSDGVITSWSFQAPVTNVPQLKFKIARPAGGNTYTIVGDSALAAPTANTLNTFPTRIPTRAGDLIGFSNPVDGSLARFTGPEFELRFLGGTGGDIPPNTTTAFPGSQPAQLDVSAVLEPDADNDGFGDETQDIETTITKGPKDKTKKKQATFEFTSNLGGATFECSLDGGPFAPCSSPDTVKVKKGKHSFAVRAAATGQTDNSPATDDWKVKKKK